jgi:hypothetical protein
LDTSNYKIQRKAQKRWEDNIIQDIRQLNVKNWTACAQDRVNWTACAQDRVNWTACAQDRVKWKNVVERAKTFNKEVKRLMKKNHLRLINT